MKGDSPSTRGMIFVAALGSAVLWQGSVLANELPVDPVVWNGHTHQLIKKPPQIWSAARDACVDKGGHLVTITSAPEQTFLVQTYFPSGNSAEKIWIGANQPSDSAEPKGGWRWVTNERWVYESWGNNKPNDNGDQDCGQMDGDYAGNWDDENCSIQRFFICEWEPTPPPIPVAPFWALGGLAALLAGIGFLRLRRRKQADL